jgi:Fe-S-cluster containining protein
MCEDCQGACKRPGWFIPGEIEKVAKHLKISVKELFKTKLAVDWWEDMEDIFVLSPALKGEETGEMFPYNPQGECVFFNKGRCDIHPVKPYECAMWSCKKPDKTYHENAKEKWNNPKAQQQIEKLLGRKPCSGTGSPLDLLF